MRDRASYPVIVFMCTECGRSTPDITGYPIDRYTWHDAPSDGLQYESPANWVINLDPWGDGPGFVLCSEHAHLEAEKVKASGDAWRKRVNGGLG